MKLLMVLSILLLVVSFSYAGSIQRYESSYYDNLEEKRREQANEERLRRLESKQQELEERQRQLSREPQRNMWGEPAGKPGDSLINDYFKKKKK